MTGPVELADFRVLSLDCYGTMIDWETGILARLAPWSGRSDTESLEAFGLAESAEQAAAPTAPYPEILRRVHHRLADVWELPPDDNAAAAFGRSVGDWPAFPDAPDALPRLASRYRLVVLSNVDGESFARSNRRLGIGFDAVYTAQDIGAYKPDPRTFNHLIDAEAAAGYGRSDLLHVGQSLYHDHVPAGATGLATCWVRRPTRAGEHGAARAPARRPALDFEFGSLAELADAAGV